MRALAHTRVTTQQLPAVALRDATIQDCEQIWLWNFAPEIRAVSRRPEIVAFADHARWLSRRLADGRDPIWVIESLGGPVGVVRLDSSGSGQSRISIALAAAARGRRIGRRAISEACRRWGRPVYAEILADNLASRACFEACGFRSVVECDGLLIYHWDPELG
jgi:L-amino acid N-acyltransferase YncA